MLYYINIIKLLRWKMRTAKGLSVAVPRCWLHLNVSDNQLSCFYNWKPMFSIILLLSTDWLYMLHYLQFPSMSSLDRYLLYFVAVVTLSTIKYYNPTAFSSPSLSVCLYLSNIVTGGPIRSPIKSCSTFYQQTRPADHTVIVFVIITITHKD